MLLKGQKNILITSFFKYTSIILVIFAAGILNYGVHELLEVLELVGVDIGVLDAEAFNINPPVNPDGSYPPLHEKGVIGSFLKSLIGYDENLKFKSYYLCYVLADCGISLRKNNV